MILDHSDLKSILNASDEVDSSGFLKSLYISYHDLEMLHLLRNKNAFRMSMVLSSL